MSCVVLPAAAPGILAGVVLDIGRIVGETAALIYTAGTVAGAASSLSDLARTLTVHMNQTYATAAVLLTLAAGINGLSFWAARRLTHGKKV